MLGSRKYETQATVYKEIGGPNWKTKVTHENALILIEKLKKTGMQDKHGNPLDHMVIDKIKRLKEFHSYVTAALENGHKVHCGTCGGFLYEEANTLLTLAEYEGRKCPHPSKCK